MKKVRKIIYGLGIIALLASCNAENAREAKTGDAKETAKGSGSEFKMDPQSTKIMWRGTKPGGEHHGTVMAEEGKLNFENGNITAGTFIIDLNSIVNEDLKGDMNGRLVGHLKSEDFFYTEQYPEAVFEMVSVNEYSGEATLEGIEPTHEITGNLTMRGQTKSITFPARVEAEGNQVSVRTNEFAIDRTKWGVNFKSKSVFNELKDDYIGDMINLKFDIEFNKV